MSGMPKNDVQMKKYLLWDDLPKCCRSCRHWDHDSMDEYSPSYHYCGLGLILPTRKQTCKRKPQPQEPQE